MMHNTHNMLVAVSVVMVAWVALGAHTTTATPLAKVMPWMCLERCGGNASSIEAGLKQWKAHPTVIGAVAYERFNLGADSTLVVNNLTMVRSTLQSMGVATNPMVSSYPYPPQFLSWMRQVFANPQPFIDSCVQQATTHKLSAFNIDWEPQAGPKPTQQDAADYAAFLTRLGDALHAHGVRLTVDVATWSAIWNYTAISDSSVDAMMTMSTYTDDFEAFKQQLAIAQRDIAPDKLSVGLMTTKASNAGAPFTTAELKARFDVLHSAGVRYISIWKAPIPANWWPFLEAFVAND